MYDRASVGIVNNDSLDLKKENLVKKLGVFLIDEEQVSLDQYDQINAQKT
jgi:hypothetical protein